MCVDSNGMYRSRKKRLVKHLSVASTAIQSSVKSASESLFTDICTVLYDTLLDLLCDTISSHQTCNRTSCADQSTPERLKGELRWVLSAALLRFPLLNQECSALRGRDPVLHSALMGYERSLAFHYPERVPSWLSNAKRDYDKRWFLGAWPRCLTLIYGERSLHATHPVGKPSSNGSGARMWSMDRVTRHMRHVIGALEGRMVPNNYTNAKWLHKLLHTDVQCADLSMLPRKVQVFVANMRCLFTTAYSVHQSSRVDMFGKCNLRTCGRVFYRGLVDDNYGNGVHDQGALIDILHDICDKNEIDYWRLCGAADDIYPTQLRRFCCFSCFAEWRVCMRGLLPVLTGECIRATPVAPWGKRTDTRDMITLSLSQALRRNSRIARTMREAVCAPLPPAILRRARDDVLVQLKQLLNIDVAMLLVSAELCDGAQRLPMHMPGDKNDWRCLKWENHVRTLCDKYKLAEPDAVLTSLMTKPAFFDEALRMAHAPFIQGGPNKIRIRMVA